MSSLSFVKGFVNPEFERQFHEGFVRIIHIFTFRISGIFSIIPLCFMVADMASSPSMDIPIISKIIYLVSSICMFGFMMFTKKYDFQPITFHIALFVINVFEGAFVAIWYPVFYFYFYY